MPEMTDEQRREIGERLRRGRELAAARREAGEDDGLTPSPEQLLIASSEGKVEMTSEDLFALQTRDSGGRVAPVAQREREHQGASITHQTSALVRVYKPTDWGYTPRTIPASNLSMVIRNGWLAACPDCGRANCSVNGDPNDCPGRPKRMFRECPLGARCNNGKPKRMYDPLPTSLVHEESPTDPFQISDGAYDQSTPASRTLNIVRAHVLAFHPQEAPEYGFYPIASAPAGMNPLVGTEAGVR